MRTGKAKKRKQYFSIAFIPHSGENVRVFRFSALYTKLLVFGTLSVVVLLFSSAFVFSTVHDNLELKKNRDTLFTINAKQIQEIDRLRQDAGDLDVKIKAFTARYDELARSYISSNGISLFTSGSGHAKRVSVIENIRELEAILKTLEKMGAARGIDETSTSTTRNALDAYVSALPTSWPTRGIVASSFGGRPDPFNSSYERHTGIDIDTPYGQGIVAAGSGTVLSSGPKDGYGNAVVIDHGYGITTLYGHASELLVTKGQKVERGELIARVGSTGRSTGNHLHFEVRVNNTPIDPLEFLGNQ